MHIKFLVHTIIVIILTFFIMGSGKCYSFTHIGVIILMKCEIISADFILKFQLVYSCLIWKLENIKFMFKFQHVYLVITNTYG